jgi:ADP-ribose pyrophosphatase
MDEDNVPSIRIVQERMVYSNQYGSLYDDDVRFEPAGNEGRYVRWSWRSSYSVAVLALPKRDTSLLIWNFRHSARRMMLEVVKGFGDTDRSPADVARAELREELGFIPDRLVYLGKTCADAAFAYLPMYCYLASGYLNGQADHEPSEVISGHEEFDLRQVPTLLETGRIHDSVTLLMLWQAFHIWNNSDD